MKKLLFVLIVLAFAPCLFASVIINTSLLANQAIGSGSGAFRQDAQVEIQNPGGGHALLSISNVKSPCDNQEEGAISFNAYDENGAQKQMSSISSMWGNNCTVSNGYSVLRFNVDGVDQSSDIEMRIFGRQKGIDFFGEPSFTGEQNPPGGRYIRVKRTSGLPSIVGTSDMVLNGNATGSGTLFLNAYGTGLTVLSAGGGLVQFGTALSTGGCTPTAKMQIKDSAGNIVYLPVCQ